MQRHRLRFAGHDEDDDDENFSSLILGAAAPNAEAEIAPEKPVQQDELEHLSFALSDANRLTIRPSMVIQEALAEADRKAPLGGALRPFAPPGSDGDDAACRSGCALVIEVGGRVLLDRNGVLHLDTFESVHQVAVVAHELQRVRTCLRDVHSEFREDSDDDYNGERVGPCTGNVRAAGKDAVAACKKEAPAASREVGANPEVPKQKPREAVLSIVDSDETSGDDDNVSESTEFTSEDDDEDEDEDEDSSDEDWTPGVGKKRKRTGARVGPSRAQKRQDSSVSVGACKSGSRRKQKRGGDAVVRLSQVHDAAALSALTIVELKAHLKAAHLSCTGRKDDLVQRLWAHIAAAPRSDPILLGAERVSVANVTEIDAGDAADEKVPPEVEATSPTRLSVVSRLSSGSGCSLRSSVMIPQSETCSATGLRERASINALTEGRISDVHCASSPDAIRRERHSVPISVDTGGSPSPPPSRAASADAAVAAPKIYNFLSSAYQKLFSHQ